MLLKFPQPNSTNQHERNSPLQLRERIYQESCRWQTGNFVYMIFIGIAIYSITEDIDSELRLFADDCVCYREIKNTEDTVKLQEDIDRLGCWARSWGMRFQPVKCNIMQITRKQIKKINASYSGYPK